MAPPVASLTAARRSATVAVATTAGTTGAAASSSAAATSTLVAAPAAATAMGALANAVTTLSRPTPTAVFARRERLLGQPGQLLRPLLLGQGGVPRADHTGDLDSVSILHPLQRCLNTDIPIRQRANKTRVHEGIRGSHPPLSHWVIHVF